MLILSFSRRKHAVGIHLQRLSVLLPMNRWFHGGIKKILKFSVEKEHIINDLEYPAEIAACNFNGNPLCCR